MPSHINQLKVGSLLSYVQMFLGVAVSLVYTPIMLRLLGQSEYGLYNTVSSTISILTLLNLGLNSGYIRYYAKYKQKNDTESIWKLNGLFLTIFSIIGLVSLVCGLFLSFHLDLVFSEGLTAREYEIARVLMILLTCNLAISFPMSVFSHIISANEKFIFLKVVGIIKTVLSPVVTLPILLMGFRSIAMVSVTVAFSVLTDAIYAYYVIVKLRNRFVFHGFEKGIFGSLFSYTAFIAINLIVDQVNWNVDKILLGRYKGTSMVAVYSVGYMLYQYYMMFSTSISSVFTPKIHGIIQQTKNDPKGLRERLTSLFVRVGRIQFILLGLVASGIVFFGKEFITEFWAGSGYLDAYYVALLLVLPSSIALIQNIGIEAQRAQNKHRFRAVVYVFMALGNVVMSIFLCQKYGAVGSAIGTAISLVVANGLVMNVYYHRSCNIDVICFWKGIFRASAGLILPVVCGVLIRLYVDLSKIGYFVIFAALYMLVYAVSMWFFGMNDYEREMIRNPLKRMLRK